MKSGITAVTKAETKDFELNIQKIKNDGTYRQIARLTIPIALQNLLRCPSRFLLRRRAEAASFMGVFPALHRRICEMALGDQPLQKPQVAEEHHARASDNVSSLSTRSFRIAPRLICSVIRHFPKPCLPV